MGGRRACVFISPPLTRTGLFLPITAPPHPSITPTSPPPPRQSNVIHSALSAAARPDEDEMFLLASAEGATFVAVLAEVVFFFPSQTKQKKNKQDPAQASDTAGEDDKPRLLCMFAVETSLPGCVSSSLLTDCVLINTTRRDDISANLVSA